MLPPFSVLDTRFGYWKERARAWEALGIRSGEGRDEDLVGTSERKEWARFGNDTVAPARSEFDPVLTEILVRWFSDRGHRVLDPFAGGSVRGIISEYLGRPYTGIDLRAEQITANEEQARAMQIAPRWIVGDSRELLTLAGTGYDFVLTCPPYYDLEQYSDDPRDLSNISSYSVFLESYRAIIDQTCQALRADRFVAWVVGDVRAPDGSLRGLVSDTVNAFRARGLSLYNDAILVNNTGTAAMRAPRQFNASRKLVRHHQYVLIFAKGRPSPSSWALNGATPPKPQMTLWEDAA